MELATFIIYHRWFDGISLALFGVTRIMTHGQAIANGIILIVDRSIAPRTGCAIGCNPETNAIGRVSIRHLAIRISRKRLRVYTIVDFSFIRTFAPSF